MFRINCIGVLEIIYNKVSWIGVGVQTKCLKLIKGTSCDLRVLFWVFLMFYETWLFKSLLLQVFMYVKGDQHFKIPGLSCTYMVSIRMMVLWTWTVPPSYRQVICHTKPLNVTLCYWLFLGNLSRYISKNTRFLSHVTGK